MPLLATLHASRDKILALAAAYGVKDVRVFGSVARGEDREDSDIDLLVSLEPGAGLMAMGGFLADMEDFLHRRVDVVTEKGLHWVIREQVLKEATPL
ncbi:MAG: nucleotidyltransferase family protein [Alphaproteobacteria bacterium]|nr:nucleotidyltransferase family protein [Alphaproteobacteria bacterium]